MKAVQLIAFTLAFFTFENARAYNFLDYAETENLEEVLREADCISKKSNIKCDSSVSYTGYHSVCRQNAQIKMRENKLMNIRVVGSASSDREDLVGFMTLGLADVAGKSIVTAKAKEMIKEKIDFIRNCRN